MNYGDKGFLWANIGDQSLDIGPHQSACQSIRIFKVMENHRRLEQEKQ